MKWNSHWELKGKHAFMSPSNYHWVNYSIDKMKSVFLNKQNIERGTLLHEFAANAISYRIKLSNRKTALNLFVNDCIGFGMDPEVILYFSENCFGTADAVKFNEKTKELFIFDLKTGENEAKFTQLDVYAALFCLEYGYSPKDIQIVERIYQYNSFKEQIADSNYISELMDSIVAFDALINNLKREDILE